MTKKKKLLIAVCVIVVLVVAVVLVNALTGKDKGHYAMPATETVIARESSYQAYLDQNGYADALSAAVIEVDVAAYRPSMRSFSIISSSFAITSVFFSFLLFLLTPMNAAVIFANDSLSRPFFIRIEA